MLNYCQRITDDGIQECGFLVGGKCTANKEHQFFVDILTQQHLKIVGCQSYQRCLDYEKRRENFGDDNVGPRSVKIQLHGGAEAIIDSNKVDVVSGYKWHKNGNGYAQSYPYEGVWVFMHRLLLPCDYDMEIDHINGDKLDNRMSNLRIVTSRQNAQNRHQEKTSKYPGVCKKKGNKNWTAELRYEGKKQHIGMFETEEAAFEAYCKTVKELTGQDVIIGDTHERRERFGDEAVGKDCREVRNQTPDTKESGAGKNNLLPKLPLPQVGSGGESGKRGTDIPMRVLQEGNNGQGNPSDNRPVGGYLKCSFCDGESVITDMHLHYCNKCGKKMGLL